MSNPNSARGARWEKAIVDFLRAIFGRQTVVKPRQEGHVDIGDVHLSPFVIQAKDEAQHSFSSYINDAEKQAAAAGEDFGVAVVKRRKYGTSKAYVIHSLASFARLVSRLRRAEALLLRASPELFDQHTAQNKRERDEIQ